MHTCTVTITLVFNILVIFSHSLSLAALTLTSLSIFLIWSNEKNHCCRRSNHLSPSPSIATTLISHRSPDQIITIKPSLISHCAWSLTNHHEDLFDRWSPLFFVVSHCLISGFSSRGVDLTATLIDYRCLANRCYSSQSLLLSFFFVWWFWDFGQWILMVLISGFWWFWLTVLGFWWVGWWWGLAWWWWLCGLMMETRLMIIVALIIDCSWILSQ